MQKLLRITFLFIYGLYIAVTGCFGQNKNKQANMSLQKVDRLFFIENKGQWHSDVLYLCRMGGLDAWITKYGINYTFFKIEKNNNAQFARAVMPNFSDHEEIKNSVVLGHRVLFELQNNNPNPAREGKLQMEGYYNYFIGNNPAKYATYVGLYKEAIVKNVYNGIDIRYYFDKGSLRYDFIVQPYADASQIQFKLRGQDKVYTKGDNKLCFTTRFGEVELTDLKTYQNNKVIQSKFVKNGEVWTFALGEYDHSKPLIIDPLIYSTYIGGNTNDYAIKIAVDATGNAYITGRTTSTDYDFTTGAFQTSYQGIMDIIVSKINSTGTTLLYSTYLGGTFDDWAEDITLDAAGNAYIVGCSGSTDYDVTTGVYQSTNGGDGDVIVTKLNSTGTGLLYSTYIGGTSDDWAYGIALDNTGSAYITGYTKSNDYDVTTGAFQTTYGGGISDVFVTKLNSTGTTLLYSTYIGGTSSDWGYGGIVINIAGNAYITGWTSSTNYDITTGAFQTTNQGGEDVFVTQLNATGTGLVYSTYIGGSGNDGGRSITIDNSQNVYITGWTNSTNYQTTPGVFQTTNGGSWDAFVTKLNSTGTALIFSTYIGGTDSDQSNGIAIDANGDVYITGRTLSTDYDITTGAFQTTNAGTNDVFVSKLNATGTTLLYSTYIGGNSDDWGRSIALDAINMAYIAGHTKSTDYDVTAGVFQNTHGDGGSYFDAFVTKLDLSTTTSMDNTTIPQTQTFTLYPNPAQNSVVIENFTATAQEYELTDISGKILQIYTLPQGKNSIPINLPKGMYFVRERKQGKTEKLVLE